MSTRANVIIKDKNFTLYFYRHMDGYPTCTGEDLKAFCMDYRDKMRLDVMQSAGWLIVRGHTAYIGKLSDAMKWKVGAYEPTTELHGDVDYIYIIDLVSGEITCHVPLPRFENMPKLENTREADLDEFTPVQFLSLTEEKAREKVAV